MNILISGGTGLIGRALIEELAKFDHKVFILSRFPEGVTNIPHHVQILGWDAKTPKGWANVLDEIDAIVNLAGAPLNGNGPLDIWLTKKRKKKLLESRINVNKALIEGIRAADKKPSVFVQSSAIGYYGPLGDELVDETHPAGQDFLAQVQKISAEATDEIEDMGIRRVIIRTGLVLAKNEGALEYFKFQFKLFAGGRFGSGEHYYSWIHLSDEVTAIRFLIENTNAVGPFNLVAPNPMKNKDFAKIMGKVMGRPSFFVIPAFLLKIVLGEVATVVLDGQRVSSKKLESLGFSFKFPDLPSALKDVL